MNKKEQNLELSLLDGWIQREGYVTSPEGRKFEVLDWHRLIPNYLISKDAIISLRLKVCNTPDLKVAWCNAAREIVGRRCEKNKSGAAIVSDFDMCSITAEEDCEAVLRAMGKWRD